MAQKKKNKKPAANPARGFATTSSVSKSKVSEEAVTQEEPAIILPNTANNATDVAKPAEDHGREKELSELTPEQLEIRLEESELQILVEQNGVKIKKEAARHVSRLKTERRLLRSSSEPLILSSWLPAETIDLISSQIASDTQDRKLLLPEAQRDLTSIPEVDLSFRIWKLNRAMLGLGFMEARILEATTSLLSKTMSFGFGEGTGRDTLWGLDSCIDHLALTCDRDELPDYDSHRTELQERQNREIQREELVLREAETAKTMAASTVDSSPLSKFGITTPESQEDDRPKLSSNEEHEDSGSDEDLDLDPEDYLGRYIHLQRKLHKRRPELTQVAARSGKKAKGKDNKKPGILPSTVDPKSNGILQQIHSIEDDILFDKDEAVHKWMEIRLDLVIEEAERRKHFGEPRSSAGKVPLAVPRAESVSSQEDDGSELDVGDFFSTLPEQTVDAATGMTSLSTEFNGQVLAIRDFGKFSGMNPRRIFEEACKSRNSTCKISYTIISSSSFFSRHSVTVRWTRPQEIMHPLPIPGITHKVDDRVVQLEMSEISCPDKNQSEAYVSTAALFLIFASSPREEKTYLRLPAVWRDLWAEFGESRKHQLDEVDRGELRAFRKLVEEARPCSAPATKAQAQVASKRSEQIDGSKTQESVESLQPSDGANEIMDMWRSKTSLSSYQHMLKGRINLPIWSFKEDLLAAIEAHQAIILCGETGCGKSTQVPAYILENELSNGRSCKVYCTEPRRISAISLARRVSEELGERKNDVGTLRSLVGYAIRLESQITPKTRLVYATTGIVMRMLERGNDLSGITHLVVDEVHERTIDSDFLLIVLRKLMVRRPNLRVVLMSATVNAELFSKYLNGAPIVNVPGRTFPVETRYLEDAMEVTNYGAANKSRAMGGRQEEDLDDDDDVIEPNRQSTASSELLGYSTRTKNALAQYDEYRLDYELIVRLLETVASDSRFVDYSKAILVFLPGIAEIRRLNDILACHKEFSDGWYIFPLHSTISTEDQERAFLVPPPGVRKIVIATNIAETGITIPDVTCVIDGGKHKEMRFDERRQLSRLIESFISRANAKQRRGRAGRVQNGLCFHLFTKARHDLIMAESQTPEMLRLSLQDLALRVKICKLGGIEQILSEALDPPAPKNIRRAIDSLIDVKALTGGEDLTALGRQLAKLPLDVYLGKLILLSSIFKCLDAGLTIAAVLSSKSPFSAPLGARAQADLARLAFKKGDSDLITVYNAYCSWRKVCNSAGSSEFQFCRKNFLSTQTLSSIEDLKVQLTTALVDAGFISLDSFGRASLNRARFYSRKRQFIDLPPLETINSNNDLVVDSVIAWSFYPKLLTRDGKGYRNVANNQSVSLFPSSVNKGLSSPPKFLSFYHIMQSSNKFLNAHETSAVEDFAVALVCGEAEFKMYSGVVIIDGNRLRFSITDWKAMLVLKVLRARIRDIITQAYRSPGRSLTATQAAWFDIWQQLFTRDSGVNQ